MKFVLADTFLNVVDRLCFAIQCIPSPDLEGLWCLGYGVYRDGQNVTSGIFIEPMSYDEPPCT